MKSKRQSKIMDIIFRKKKKKKRNLKDGPPIDKMVRDNDERTFVVTK